MIFTKNRPSAAERRLALREQVRPVRVCLACGVSGHVEPSTLTTIDTLGGTAEYGVCAACSTTSKRAVLASLLGIDAADPVLASITLQRFADRPGASPSRPNREPWGHLPLDTIAAEVEAKRTDIAKRTGGPCRWCGVTVTPSETSWNGDECGGCESFRHDFGGNTLSPEDFRDYMTAYLLGRVDPTKAVIISPGIGKALGVTFWSELDRTDGSTRPWAHVNIPAIRRKAATDRDLQATYLRLLENYDPAEIGWTRFREG